MMKVALGLIKAQCDNGGLDKVRLDEGTGEVKMNRCAVEMMFD